MFGIKSSNALKPQSIRLSRNFGTIGRRNKPQYIALQMGGGGGFRFSSSTEIIKYSLSPDTMIKRIAAETSMSFSPGECRTRYRQPYVKPRQCCNCAVVFRYCAGCRNSTPKYPLQLLLALGWAWVFRMQISTPATCVNRKDSLHSRVYLYAEVMSWN